VLAAAAVLLVALTACTRSTASSVSSPGQIYASGPTESDVRNLLGSNDWWESTPSFQLPPLGLPGKIEPIRFQITTRFIHLGTSEFFIAQYLVLDSTSSATQVMAAIQSNNSGAATTPRAGDQVIYLMQRPISPTALYSNAAYVRVGQTILIIDLERDQGYLSSNAMGKIANALANRLKDVTSGKVKPSPLATVDSKLLIPPGLDVTLVGAAKLPVEAAVASLGIGSPQGLVDEFHQLGVKDFVYGDYALNADLNMEVRAMEFNFSTPDDAKGWLDSLVGAGNLDAQGVASGYAASAGFYYAFFTAGSHGAFLFCNSIDTQTAASRACEGPLTDLISTWQSSLGQA
jgi:hypothetical protein